MVKFILFISTILWSFLRLSLHLLCNLLCDHSFGLFCEPCSPCFARYGPFCGLLPSLWPLRPPLPGRTTIEKARRRRAAKNICPQPI